MMINFGFYALTRHSACFPVPFVINDRSDGGERKQKQKKKTDQGGTLRVMYSNESKLNKTVP